MNCPRGMNPRHHEVILGDHAWGRWLERCKGIKIKRGNLVSLLRYQLNVAISLGLPLDSTGAGWIEITPEIWATVRLTDLGWKVTTITRWDEKEEAG